MQKRSQNTQRSKEEPHCRGKCSPIWCEIRGEVPPHLLIYEMLVMVKLHGLFPCMWEWNSYIYGWRRIYKVVCKNISTSAEHTSYVVYTQSSRFAGDEWPASHQNLNSGKLLVEGRKSLFCLVGGSWASLRKTDWKKRHSEVMLWPWLHWDVLTSVIEHTKTLSYISLVWETGQWSKGLRLWVAGAWTHAGETHIRW